ncbi:preprotein translocase subunit SecG [Chakrabartyella piscis]|uniref:preprotein translocase subunit SecG n=1 Tax=Chakrabartyella piscis TaxID=2918914 RepID=UPI002958D1FD|nr:preprotein translocase subunit SecG [Chakrabartyella piscis]
MTTIGLILSVIMMVDAVGLCVIILMQSKRAAGLGAIGGDNGGGDSYWSKNKSSSVEGTLEKYTKIGGAIFMILAFAINLVG